MKPKATIDSRSTTRREFLRTSAVLGSVDAVLIAPCSHFIPTILKAATDCLLPR